MEYRDSGVDRNLAYDWIESLQTKIAKTKRSEVLSEIGDFGGFFEAPRSLKEPVFVAATDGVGTKLLLAEEVGGKAHQAVGQDCVAMCVNDLLACGAEPLVFLDYLATGKLDSNVVDHLLEGIVNACLESGCALIGGETAQMPGFYAGSRYDVAGFSIGAMEKSKRFKPADISAGDQVFGCESDGFHSNGFSLVRKILEKKNWNAASEMEGEKIYDFLLRPTRLYIRPILDLMKRISLKGAAHITGGGLIENLPRAIDEKKVYFEIEKSAITTAPQMKLFVEAGGLTEIEAFSTWNMGIGFCFVVSPAEAAKISEEDLQHLRAKKLGVIKSKMAASEPSVRLI